MPFRFFQLPQVATRELIKSLDPLEIFYLYHISKRVQNVMSFLIPINCIHFYFTASLGGNLDIVAGSLKLQTNIQGEIVKFHTGNQGHNFSIDFQEKNLEVPFNCTGDKEKTTTSLIFHLMEVFKTQKLDLVLECGIKPDYILELLRYLKKHNFELGSVQIMLYKASPETINEILRDHSDGISLSIDTELPVEYRYDQPPGGFKMKKLVVYNEQHLNLDDFLDCESVEVYFKLPQVTPAYLNTLFRKVIRMECRIEELSLYGSTFTTWQFVDIVNELSVGPFDVYRRFDPNNRRVNQPIRMLEKKIRRVDFKDMIIRKNDEGLFILS